MKGPKRRTLALLMLATVAASCSSGQPERDEASIVGKPAAISHIHGLAVDAEGALYVATHDGLLTRTGDGSFVYASADTNDHMGFSLHPRDGVMYRSGHSPAKPSLGVESSSDGAQWKHLADVADPPVDFHAMAVSYADSRTLWGWDSGGRGTFRSSDGGETWQRLAADSLPTPVYVLAGTRERNVVLAGTANGLYRSEDGGDTWRALRNASSGWVAAIAADPSDPKRLMVSTPDGVRLSGDDGATWQPAATGLPAGAEILHLTISPADGETAYAADSTTIYTTVDGGTTWNRVSPR